VQIDAGGGGGGGNDDCAESAKVVYLVTEQGDLRSFNPEVGGMAAYQLVGALSCDSSSSPQSMAVDRSGQAYVFYSNGKLFRVSTKDASCQSTNYSHPVLLGCLLGCQLGMGFTADVAGSNGQRLYIMSPDFGLATVDTGSMAVDKKNAFSGTTAELTGGIDARLFMFDASAAQLSEVDQSSLQKTDMHTFNLSGVLAFAFARYAGKFYMFTAQGSLSAGNTTTTVYDPHDDSETTRDQDVGFTVVGAGQSTCVPPPPVY
jgi:hypothetical protein